MCVCACVCVNATNATGSIGAKDDGWELGVEKAAPQAHDDQANLSSVLFASFSIFDTIGATCVRFRFHCHHLPV